MGGEGAWEQCLKPRQLLPPSCFKLDLRARPWLAGVGEHLQRRRFRHQEEGGGVGQERLGPSYFFISLVLGPLNSLLWYVPSSRYI
jgi:hypothetical protein